MEKLVVLLPTGLSLLAWPVGSLCVYVLNLLSLSALAEFRIRVVGNQGP